MLVKGSSILEFVEINMSTFHSHVQQDVGVILSCVNAVMQTIAQARIWPRPFIEHIETTRAHAYLDTAISIYIGAPRC